MNRDNVEKTINDAVKGTSLSVRHEFHRPTNADWWWIHVGEWKPLPQEAPIETQERLVVVKVIDVGGSDLIFEQYFPDGKKVRRQWAEAEELVAGVLLAILESPTSKDRLASLGA